MWRNPEKFEQKEEKGSKVGVFGQSGVLRKSRMLGRKDRLNLPLMEIGR